MKKHYKLIFIAVLTVFTVCTLTACKKAPNADSHPYDDFNFNKEEMRLIVPADWELEIGDSRTVDFAFVDYVDNRKLTWYTSDESIATVDNWGRVTAVKAGKADVVAANSDKLAAKVTLNVVDTSTPMTVKGGRVDYELKAATYGDNLQKVVTRYPSDSVAIPEELKNATDFSAYQSATTEDGAVWTITPYGVLREYNDAVNERDKKQRFMGDRYFYEADTTTGKVLAILSDGSTGIWTRMATGATHIEMLKMSGVEKAVQMSENTASHVSRRGMVSEAYLQSDGTWKPNESDNDGLWTSMYGAGELMRYAVLRERNTATPEEIAAAKQSATIATEAVLLLSNICMRTGTVEAYVRYQPNAEYDDANGRFLSEEALVKDGDSSINNPWESPAQAFKNAWQLYYDTGEGSYFLEESYLKPYAEKDWIDPRVAEEGVEFARRTRNLEGYISRTYSLRDENNPTDGYVHWSLYKYDDNNKRAEGVSTRNENDKYYYINGENLREVQTDASGEIPQRLWTDLIGEGYSVSDIVYKGDTSADEIIGHLFLYKLAYDILGPEDEELKSIIVRTMDRFAQHISDNGYMMVDGSGQPGTWSKFNRDFFYNSSQLGGAPLTASVLLSAFKVAAYVTGNQKWENEYRMAALDVSYEYAELMTQYSDQCDMYMLMLVDSVDLGGLEKNLKTTLKNEMGGPLTELLNRLFLNYSDEEMAMLAFYLLFQLETDENLLNLYRTALDGWWDSVKYSENPLWYYIYQLAYPDEAKTDAYGNSLIETAAWSLSRHPIDTRKYLASNTNRDDVKELDINDYLDVGDGAVLCYDISAGDPMTGAEGTFAVVSKLLGTAPHLSWAVAAPDERALHKYNAESYELDGNYNPNQMEGSTTYTLPFWLGMYHGMLEV